MKHIQAKKEWRSSQELANSFHPLSKTLNRLMVLDYVWDKVVGKKAAFWNLQSVRKDTLYVQVKVSVAKNELITKRAQMIKELNKYFEKPWIKQIEII